MSDWATVRRDHGKRQHPFTVVSTLDLHGLTKEKAISTLTTFLSKILILVTKRNEQQESIVFEPKNTPTTTTTYNEKNHWRSSVVDYSQNKSRCNPSGKANAESDKGIWVHIITGAGRHSGINGPVLRNAVQKLLEKRCITYRLTNDKGGFLVRVDSGYELYPIENQLNTKLLLKKIPQNHVISSSTSSSCISAAPVDPSTLFDCSFSNPLPSQVHAEMKHVYIAKQLSSHEEQIRQNDLFLEQIQQAVEESFLHSLLDQNGTTSTNDKLEEEQDEEYDEEMKRALQESIQQPYVNGSQEQRKKMEDMEMERALAASQLDQEEAEYARRIGIECDDELLKALRLSLDDKQSMTDQELLQIAISKSIHEF